MSAAQLVARLAAAAGRTAQLRTAMAVSDPRTEVATVGGGCCKPWATDGCGTITEVCAGRPAHHTGPCGEAPTPSSTA